MLLMVVIRDRCQQKQQMLLVEGHVQPAEAELQVQLLRCVFKLNLLDCLNGCIC